MTYRVILSSRALRQLDSIFRYIEAAANTHVALDFINSILAHCEGLAQFPQRGTVRNELRPGLRLIGFRRRVTIAFDVESSTVNVLGILYGGQDVAGTFDDKNPDTQQPALRPILKSD